MVGKEHQIGMFFFVVKVVTVPVLTKSPHIKYNALRKRGKEMNNALKIILKERKLTQNYLAFHFKCVKQNVSKWVLRERKIPQYSITELEKIFGVPSRYFVGEDGYCKILTDDEKTELEIYLSTEIFQTNGSESEELRRWLEEQRNPEEQRRAFYCDIKKINARIKEDILSNPREETINSYEDWLNCVETNIFFYNRILKLRGSKRITDREWSSIGRALYELLLQDTESSLIDSDSLAGKLYQVILEDRERMEKKRLEDLKDYKEIFGDFSSV